MKIIIADDDGLIRDSLKLILELQDDIEVVATAENGEEVINFCTQYSPDIVLMDIRMPILDGVLATKEIKNQQKDIKIIILTTFKDDEYIAEAIKNGAEGYILKNQDSDSIIECLRTVYNGNGVFQRDILNSLMCMIRNKKTPSNKVNLTEREFEILALIGEGLSNKEISKKVYLSEGTIRNYITNLLQKLQLRDRTQLAIYYLKNY
ncbi:response regulator transcription factor [Clostridium botulinum]|uniref:Stage 0 sporulation protein A homolog n=1 Tax=Clostridium botulinum C/D str. DC5 TaxID=1443128 RepID=A0A0A0IJI2_CLOBO|nr:response regulator transcription factor [Clostridium botulinum]KGM95715.1 LuxR family transcriptional regulator [Clostridium botulinum D str. CCUG 7971]KGN00442.1 LuxR family transcriptional regulator [Clostridium botulinum C/D str. DC5]KOC48036.1 LuxR family transcriptional regulator [Clostridium botulinum]KOC52779.1 LuxR family transcriptional regulator [Clostridium botulinum]KOC58213.1 LuxR family transcriptional regulator [Clostridium botulinum]